MPGIEALQTVLFVDDEPHVLRAIDRLLRQKRAPWRCLFAEGVTQALEILETDVVDAVISDIKMPQHDGFHLLATLRHDPRFADLPVVILTGLNDPGLKSHALDLGATDLLNKPVDADELVARIRSVLHLKRCQDEIKRHNEELEDLVRRRTSALAATRLDLIWRLGKAAEFRSQETGNHVIRVGYYAKMLAERLGLARDEVETLFHTAPLHDVGKIGIPDSILLKPGPLNTQERSLMQTHCRIGKELLSQAVLPTLVTDNPEELPQEAANPLLPMAASIAYCHHEHWDGSGYPEGLRHEATPLPARIVSLCDVFDALGSQRVYKQSLSPGEVLHIMQQGNGSHFDPDIFAVFKQCQKELLQVRRHYEDQEPTVETEQE